jgi:predicted permease
MARLRYWFHRLQALWRSEQVHDEIAEEMRFHIEERTVENIRRGMSPEEARHAAEQKFGHLTQIREKGYELRGGGWAESLLQDLAYGVRLLRRRPGFTLAASLTLALGIGANTAVFSVMESVLLRPLPYEHAERLYMVREQTPQEGNLRVSGPDFDDFSHQSRSFEFLSSSLPYFTFAGGVNGNPRTFTATGVDEQFFPALGVKPLMGRMYRPAEYHIDSCPMVVSNKFWREQLNSDPHVIGRVFKLADESCEIAGVMPDIPDLYPNVDIWAKMIPELEFMHWRQNKFLTVIGRLKPGVSPQQAEQEMTTILRRGEGSAESSVRLLPLRNELVGKVRTQLTILMGAVLLVLVIVCVNVIYLLLARMSGRATEVAIRLSLGARPGRILRQLVTENLLLVAIGSGLGLVLAVNLVRMVRDYNLGALPRGQQIAMNGPVLVFGMAVAVFLSIALAWGPFTLLGRININAGLKGGRAIAGRPRYFRTLVLSEVCCATVLLVGAGLLVRSFWMVQHVDPGFLPDHLLTAYLRTNYFSVEGVAFYDRILDLVAHSPDVQSAAFADCYPATRASTATVNFSDRANEPANPTSVEGCWTSPDFFRSIGVPLIQGRVFSAHDGADAPPVVIINKALANKYWPGEDPLGKRLAVSYLGPGRRSTGQPRFREIVGVVGDVKQKALDLPALPALYMPFYQDETHHVNAAMNLFVRTTVDPRAVSATVRKLVSSVNPDQPVDRVRTMDDALFDTLAPRRFSLILLGSFAALALLLCAIGIYGTIAYALSQRTREFGVRIAVGASREDLLNMVMKEGMLLVGVGLALGGGLSVFFGRAMANLLFAISPFDPLAFAAAGAVLLLVAAAACFFPAWRAAGADPVQALRAD